MTNSQYRRIEESISLQFDIMNALQQKIEALKAQGANARELSELETLVKYLAKKTSETNEEILRNVA